MQSWWIAAAGRVLAGLAYFARRVIEGRRRWETLKRRLQALALVRGMRRAGVTIDELEQLSDEP